ncbi:MAG: hypothetical protein ACE5IB_06890 [Candidatus Geothermarchaeales archaeon]
MHAVVALAEVAAELALYIVDEDSSLEDVVFEYGVVLEDVDVLDPGGISSVFSSSWKSLRGASLTTPGEAVVASLD